MKLRYLFFVSFLHLQISAQVGFNLVGYINQEGGTNSSLYRSVTLDRNNKIVLVGQTDDSDGLIARYNENGTLDTTFNAGSVNGGPGYINVEGDTNSSIYYSVAVDRNNKIVAVGRTDNSKGLIARYNENGTLDTTFNINAVDGAPGFINTNTLTLTDFYYSVVIDRNNKIVAVGQTNDMNGDRNGLIARYHENGTLDTSFNPQNGFINGEDGTNSYVYYSVALDKNNKIVVVGQTDNNNNEINGLIVRYNANGSLDTTFNKTGYINLAQPTNSSEYYSVVFDGNHKICAVGQTKAQVDDRHGLIARYLSNGVLDAESNWNLQNFRESNNINKISIGLLG